jgi:hypothetical protein
LELLFRELHGRELHGRELLFRLHGRELLFQKLLFLFLRQEVGGCVHNRYELVLQWMPAMVMDAFAHLGGGGVAVVALRASGKIAPRRIQQRTGRVLEKAPPQQAQSPKPVPPQQVPKPGCLYPRP